MDLRRQFVDTLLRVICAPLDEHRDYRDRLPRPIDDLAYMRFGLLIDAPE
jgi:hypothetical protein